MNKFYAGIGARKTPGPVLTEMSNVAMQLAMRGFTLRSGKAQGADMAFEHGCDVMGGSKLIRCATLWQPAVDHAAQFHPNWSACDEHAKGLHARNSLVMLGDQLDQPVSFVVCWAADGKASGGTGQALRIADALDIPVFNLAACSVDDLWSWLNGKT